jgi:hypothetical protein
MSELFPVEAVQMDSPRLAWMKKHGVITYRSPVEPVCWFAGFQEWWPKLEGVGFFAKETAHNGDIRVGEGATEDEALCQLAKWEGIKLWNEEGKSE